MDAQRRPTIVARYPRGGALIGAAGFGVFGGVIFDSLFTGYIPPAEGFDPSSSIGLLLFLYVMLAGFAFSFVLCAKTAVWPSLIFAADDDGVVLGKGVFRNTKRRLPWSAVQAVSPGRIRVHGHNRPRMMPAIKIDFFEDHGMGGSGLDMGHPTSSTQFAVAEAVLRMSVDDAIAKIEQLRERAGQAAGGM